MLSGKSAGLIRDGFSSPARRATQECRESFEVAQQSCRRKDARSSGVNFPDSALDPVALDPSFRERTAHDFLQCLEALPIQVIALQNGRDTPVF